MSTEPFRASPTTLRSMSPAARHHTADIRPVTAQGGLVGGAVPRRSVGEMCVVVTNLADNDGQVLIRNLRRRGTGRVILLARRASRTELVSLLTGGLRGAIASESPDSVPTDPSGSSFTSDRPELTMRELGVLRLVADGCSNRAVGERLGLSALTVKSHLARISRKLGTGDRAALVAISIRTGRLD